MKRSLSIFCFAVLAIAGAAQAQPSLQFGTQTVTVNGITPQGNVALFAVAKEPADSHYPPIPQQTRHALLLEDTDGDGDVVFERGRDIPLLGVWVAVDLTTGDWAASGSPEFEAESLDLGTVAVSDGQGVRSKMSLGLPEGLILCVRPGVDAWQMYAARKSGLDESAAWNTDLRVDIGHMTSLSNSEVLPAALEAGDVIVVIDPMHLSYGVTEVPVETP